MSSLPICEKWCGLFGSKDSNFFALDAVTGKLKWKFPNSGQVLSAPAISNNVVYFGQGIIHLWS